MTTLIVGQRQHRRWTGIRGGWVLDHQSIVPPGHITDEVDVLRVRLEKRFDEKRRVSLTEHPHEEGVALDKRNRCVRGAHRLAGGWWSLSICSWLNACGVTRVRHVQGRRGGFFCLRGCVRRGGGGRSA